MQFHGLAPFGISDFSNAPTPAYTAYLAILAAYGPLGDKDLTTYYGSRHFAKAILIGCARRIIERAANQQHPLSVKDKIASLETDWGITPPPTADLNQRQLALAAQMLLMTGSKQIAIETALTALLGANFYTVRVTQPTERFNTPTDPSTQGSFQASNVAPKYLTLSGPVFPGPFTVGYALLGDTTAPLVGDVFTVDPADENRCEAIAIAAVDPAGKTITATFTSVHNPLTIAATCMPMWRSNQRHVAVVAAPVAARDPETRRQIHMIMQRHMKSVTDWSIVEASSSSTVGPWVVGVARVGSTALGDTATST